MKLRNTISRLLVLSLVAAGCTVYSGDASTKTTHYALVSPARLSTLVADMDLFAGEKKKVISQADALIKSGQTFSVTTNKAADDPKPTKNT